jgi:hypothetical protein
MSAANVSPNASSGRYRIGDEARIVTRNAVEVCEGMIGLAS